MNWAELICQTGGLLSPTECAELGSWALRAKGDALEVGHYTGLSTSVLLACLPRSVSLWTVDNHSWRPGTRESFDQNVKEHIDRDFHPVFADFRETDIPGPFSFVFYDGPHSAPDCEAFWERFSRKFADQCVLLFDDADWPTMDRLRELAAAAGFTVVTEKPLARHVIPYSTDSYDVDLDLGKRHPATYTIEVMSR